MFCDDICIAHYQSTTKARSKLEDAQFVRFDSLVAQRCFFFPQPLLAHLPISEEELDTTLTILWLVEISGISYLVF